MSDFIIKTGDTAIFNPTFGNAIVVVVPGTISGSGRLKVDGSIACVEGDEASVVVAGVGYTSPPAVTPGVGTLTIAALGSDQVGTRTSSVHKATILKGSTFVARFTVQVPATQPGSNAPDPVPVHSGTGQFVTSNLRSKGT